jgi:hypothetical protein
MFSLNDIFKFFPLLPEEERFQESVPKLIRRLSDAEAIALLPGIRATLTEEIKAWERHCAIAQRTSYTAIITQLDEPGASVGTVQAIALHHLAETVTSRVNIVASKTRSKPRELWSGVRALCRDHALSYEKDNHSVFDLDLVKAMSELEATMTGLENSRLDQLRFVRARLLETHQFKFKYMEHVLGLVREMEQLGINIECISPAEE